MKIYLITSFAAMAAGYILDLIFGDPDVPWHPIRLIGGIISKLESLLNLDVTHSRDENAGIKKRRRGTVLVILTLVAVAAVVCFICIIAYTVHPLVYFAAETVLVWLGLAQTSLKRESMKVYDALAQNDTEKARFAVSMIVGRDTQVLTEEGIMRAAIETVAENTSDGVTAPLFYCALFGAAGEYIYKAINTMDSMIGYKNEKYMDFGRCAAKLDDAANFIPSRISAHFMIATAYILRYDYRNAAKIFRRDRRKHASPNSAQTESVCAGALDLRLAGDAWYGGVLFKKEYIGDDIHPVKPYDIRRACRLMSCTGALSFAAAVAVRLIVLGLTMIF